MDSRVQVSKLLETVSDCPQWITQGPFNCGNEQLPCFEYVCYICDDTRGVAEIVDFYNDKTNTLMSDVENGEIDASELTDSFFEDCFFKIRNEGKSKLFDLCRCF
jgi:hypothetical protein